MCLEEINIRAVATVPREAEGSREKPFFKYGVNIPILGFGVFQIEDPAEGAERARNT